MCGPLRGSVCQVTSDCTQPPEEWCYPSHSEPIAWDQETLVGFPAESLSTLLTKNRGKGEVLSPSLPWKLLTLHHIIADSLVRDREIARPSMTPWRFGALTWKGRAQTQAAIPVLITI